MEKSYFPAKKAILFIIVGFITLTAAANATGIELKGNWQPQIKARLEAKIAANANQGKVCVFDFDNTTICRDIGEATMAALSGAGLLTHEKYNLGVTPDAFTLQGKEITMEGSGDFTVFYENFLSATKHHKMESTPYENGYGWVVQAMAPMSPNDWLPYTDQAYGNGISAEDQTSTDLSETKINGYRMPFFYPEMVDLYGVLLKNGYKVYISSASNVHTVRWMVKNHLNKKIEELHGKGLAIPPENVIGVSMLMIDDRTGELCKDPYLVRENKKYADLDPEELSHYTLTSQVCHPMNGYFGKVANIMKYITLERPFLIAGDSSNDLPMLNWSENRLWMARLEKMGYQETMVETYENSLAGEWFIQPVLYKKAPGFVSSQADLDKRFNADPAKKDEPQKTVSFLKMAGFLNVF